MNTSEIKATKYVENLMKEEPTGVLLRKLKDHDEYTFKHSVNVAIYTAMLFELPGLSCKRDSVLGALLHDVGKLDIPARVLNKKEKLSVAEIELLKHHPMYTYQWLELYNYPVLVKNIGLYHHEKLDGSGYPLNKKSINKNVQLVTICDMYDALTTERPYHKKFSKQEAFEELYTAASKGLINTEYLDYLESLELRDGVVTAKPFCYTNEITIGVVSFRNINQLFSFVNALSATPFNAYLYTEDEVINAKSLISVCRLNSFTDVALTIDSEKTEDITAIKNIVKKILRVA